MFDNTLSEKDKKDIKKFIKSDNSDKKFEDIKKSLDDHQKKSLKKEERLTDKEKNQIWNFCLLDEHTNKSYGNSIYISIMRQPPRVTRACGL